MAAETVAAETEAASLTAFIVVYFFVFGAGVYYVLRMMHAEPGSAEEKSLSEGPTRTAGITPAPQHDPDAFNPVE